jgi:type VI secretion system protein ImpG
MAASQDELLRAYQRELLYLRQEGARFAARYPKVASRLQLSVEDAVDPHVERLLESFAFLTGRIQHALDSELPELTTSLLGLLYPHLVEPVPSLSVACFEVDPDSGLALAGHCLERDTPLLSESSTGLTCRFRTCRPVTLWPVEVVEARVEPPRAHPFLRGHGDVAAVLRLRLRARGTTFSRLTLERLAFFLDGPSQVTWHLYELLSRSVLRVALLPDGASGEPLLQPAKAVRPLGFDEDEALLPAPPQAHRGYRLLQEYFSFPEKFLFFELTLGQEAVRAASTSLDVLLLLDTVPDEDLVLERSTFRLGCTPIVNLFHRTAEPIRLDQRHTEYRLVADRRFEQSMEIHSLQSVTALPDRAERTREVAPLFSFRHEGEEREPRAYWFARRRPTGREDLPGSELLLSFVDLDLEPRLPADQTVYAHTLCTNRDLAVQVPAGAALMMEERAPLRGITCLRRPTPQWQPPLGGPSLWRLVSLLSLNHLSLTGGQQSLDVLRELLRLHDFSPQRLGEQQLRGLVALDCRQVVRQQGTEAWRGLCRGLEVTLTFDEARFVGGSALLLGAVLSRFLGMYVAVDSFVQLVARSEQREGEWKRWPPMAGEQPLL